MNGNTRNFPDELLYDMHYQWVKRTGNKVLVGLTPYGIEITGEVLYLSLPPVGTEVDGGGTCGSLEAGKWVGRVYAPVSGKVINVNNAIVVSPALISHSPYNCWFVEIEMSRPDELHDLMSAVELSSWLIESRREDA